MIMTAWIWVVSGGWVAGGRAAWPGTWPRSRTRDAHGPGLVTTPSSRASLRTHTQMMMTMMTMTAWMGGGWVPGVRAAWPGTWPRSRVRDAGGPESETTPSPRAPVNTHKNSVAHVTRTRKLFWTRRRAFERECPHHTNRKLPLLRL